MSIKQNILSLCLPGFKSLADKENAWCFIKDDKIYFVDISEAPFINAETLDEILHGSPPIAGDYSKITELANEALANLKR